MKRINRPLTAALFFTLILAVPSLAIADDKASDREQRKVQQQRKRYESMPAEERRKVDNARKKYKKMSPEQQRKLKEKWEKERKKSANNR